MGFPGGSVVKNLPANAGDVGSTFGLGRSLGEGNGNPLQYSCLANPLDGGAGWAAVHGVAKSRTWLSDFPFTFHFDALEKEMATHSSALAWRIPGTGEPGGLPSMGSHRVGHDCSDLAAAAAAAAGTNLVNHIKVFSTIHSELSEHWPLWLSCHHTPGVSLRDWLLLYCFFSPIRFVSS